MIYNKSMTNYVITTINNNTYLIISEIVRAKKNIESANMIKKYMDLFSAYDEEIEDLGLDNIFDETRNDNDDDEEMALGDIFDQI